MGGGEDSRIPAILSECLALRRPDIRVVVRTYSFDPDEAFGQISAWVQELDPALVIGESMGATHALCVRGVPHILVSPAMGTPSAFTHLAWLSLVPGVTALLDHIYKPRPGRRQPLHFKYDVLRRWKGHKELAYSSALSDVASGHLLFAFFGTRDHYRKWGIVNVRAWKRRFGEDTFAIYDGTHFMEEEHIHTFLVPKICQTLPEA